jgi:3-deoxy-D-manno-octulosonic-acid transferase
VISPLFLIETFNFKFILAVPPQFSEIFNFKDIYSILTKAGAAKIVKTQHDLYDEMNKLLNNESVYIDAQNACDGVFKEQQGATDFVINILKRIQYTKEKVANN